MKIIHEILAFALLLVVLIGGYYYFSMESTSNNVTVQKLGTKAEKEAKNDTDTAVSFEEDPAHQEEEADGAEAGLVIAGEAA